MILLSTSIYCQDAEEARRVLGLKSTGALYRRVRKHQVAGVVRLKEEGKGPNGRERHGSLKFIRAELALRPTPPKAAAPQAPVEADPDNPRNWGKRLSY